MPRIARSYQADAADAVKALWREGRRRVVVVGPVGAGKTFVAELLMVPALEHEWAQVFFCAHTEQLVDQPATRFSHIGIQSAFLKAGRRADPTQALQFCSAATLTRRDVVAALNSKGEKYNRVLLVIDECHRVKSSTYMAILDKFRQAFQFVYIILLTATPYRLDGRGLADVADALIEISTPRRLIADGVILSPRYYSTPLPEGDDVDAIVVRSGVVGDVVAEWQKHGRGLPTICRAYSIDHSKLLVARFTQAGVVAAHIDGTMTTACRRRLLVALATGRLTILCAGSNIFDEGFDSRASYEMLLPQTEDAREAWRVLRCPSVELSGAECLRLRQRVLDGVLPELRDFWPTAEAAAPMEPPVYHPLRVLVDASPSASMGAWMQRQGRVVRSWLGDDEAEVLARSWQDLEWSRASTEAYVLCHSGNLERHGALIWHDSEHCENFALKSDAQWATKLRPRRGVAAFSCPKPRTCAGCLAVDVEGGATCVWCGAVLAVPVLPEERRGELVERDAATAVMSTPGVKESFLKARYAEMASRIKSGLPPYKSGYAAANFHRRFGHWPQRELDQMLRRQFGIS